LAGASQTVPQPPQLPALVFTSTQAPSHFSKPFSHSKSQPELRHEAAPCSGTGQRWPQPPQCWAFVAVSTQAEAQLVSSAAQSSEHAPLEQTWPSGHALSQAPQ
jgi:hypothetical protein